MTSVRLFFSYFIWHYTQGVLDCINLLKGFIVFFWHFFSIQIMFKTLFKKWERLGERYKKGFDIENIFSAFVINSLMRIVGVLIRGTVIISGLFVTSCVAIASLFVLLLWLVTPFILIFLTAVCIVFAVSLFKL